MARLLLRLAGWRLVGEPPPIQRCVVVFAPHTSNWDFVLMFVGKLAFGLHAAYLAKHTLFRWPIGWFFRRTSGIPVERHKSDRRVEQIARLFAERDRLWLALSPEGTRSRTDHWKSGFYRIALAAQVPVLLVYLDAAKKELGIGELVHLTGNAKYDLRRIRAFYRDKLGLHPERMSQVRFKP